jgi:hypothetical protein
MAVGADARGATPSALALALGLGLALALAATGASDDAEPASAGKTRSPAVEAAADVVAAGRASPLLGATPAVASGVTALSAGSSAAGSERLVCGIMTPLHATSEAAIAPASSRAARRVEVVALIS